MHQRPFFPSQVHEWPPAPGRSHTPGTLSKVLYLLLVMAIVLIAGALYCDKSGGVLGPKRGADVGLGLISWPMVLDPILHIFYFRGHWSRCI